MTSAEIELMVYPDDCDSFGHVNQASFLRLFERARWETLRQGPGIDFFTRAGAWPALRKATIEYQASAFPGEALRFTQTLLHQGRTSFSLRQVARRAAAAGLIATADFVFVCVDRQGKPVPVPDGLGFLDPGATGPSAVPRGSSITVNGVTLAYDDQGEGPPLLFVHGYPLDRTIWRDQVQNLRGWRCVAPDLRGMGHSDAPDLGYSMATYAGDLVALMDSLDLGQAVICGLSMGGYIALELLRSSPERVRGLVLVSTRAEAESVEGRRARDQAAAQARDGGAAAVAEAMIPRILAPVSYQNDSLLGQVRQIMERTPVAGIAGALAAMRDRPDSTSLLPTLAVPILLIAGEMDQLVPLADMTRMHDAIPGSVLRVVPSAGHLPPVEQPGETTRILQEFLNGLAP